MSTNPIWLCAAKLGVPEDRPRSRGQKRRLISAAAPRMMHIWIVLLALAFAALVVAAPGGGGDSDRRACAVARRGSKGAGRRTRPTRHSWRRRTRTRAADLAVGIRVRRRHPPESA